MRTPLTLNRGWLNIVSLLMLLAGLVSSTPATAQTEPPIPSGDIRIHYYRPDGIYTGWTIYAFFDTTEPNNFAG